jgi:hypothetical protein
MAAHVIGREAAPLGLCRREFFGQWLRNGHLSHSQEWNRANSVRSTAVFAPRQSTRPCP